MKTVAVTNPKGGCAKTTTTVNLAAAVAESGCRVLIVDLDPQGSATQWLGVFEDIRHDVNFLQNGVGLDTLSRPGSINGIDIVPAPKAFLQADSVLANHADAESLLKSKLERLGDWDVVFLDCPASLGVLTQNALVAADQVITPVEASVMGLISLMNLFEGIEKLKKGTGLSIAPVRVLPCRVDKRTKHAQEVVDKLRAKLGKRVFQQVIHANVRLTECPGFLQSVMEYAPDSSGAQDYRGAAHELLNALGELQPYG